MENTEQGTQAPESTPPVVETQAAIETQQPEQAPLNEPVVHNEASVSKEKAATAEVYVITESDIENHPELKDQGVEAGSVVAPQSLWVYIGKAGFPTI
jgi:hypothetical protein